MLSELPQDSAVDLVDELLVKSELTPRLPAEKGHLTHNVNAKVRSTLGGGDLGFVALAKGRRYAYTSKRRLWAAAVRRCGRWLEGKGSNWRSPIIKAVPEPSQAAPSGSRFR